MSKRRLSSSRSHAPRKRLSSRAKTYVKPKNIPCSRYIGVSLLGGKSDRTCVAVLEYFPNHGKLFLHQLFEKIQSANNEDSADSELIRTISSFLPQVEALAFDVPLQLPKCLRCNLKCPGSEVCKVSEIAYMRELQKKHLRENKNAKFMTPYTQRPVELYIQKKLERPYYMQDALGANLAPLTARAQYILKRLQLPFMETYPTLSFTRIAEQMGLPEKFLKQEGRSFEPEEARQAFLNMLIEKRLCFIYQQDILRLIENPDAFDAFLSSFTAFLSQVGECEERPRGFPKAEIWLQFPKLDVAWANLFKDLPHSK